MKEQKEFAQELPEVIRKSSGWLMGLGILFIVLGFLGLSMMVTLTLVSVLFLGILFIIAGISQFIDIVKEHHISSSLWHALLGILYIAGGIIMMYDPLLASTIITAYIAAILIVIGVVRMIMGMTMRGKKGRGWIVFAGLISIILGVLILAQWPWSGLWILGMFVAIDLIMNGWTYLFLALAIRSAAKEG